MIFDTRRESCADGKVSYAIVKDMNDLHKNTDPENYVFSGIEPNNILSNQSATYYINSVEKWKENWAQYVLRFRGLFKTYSHLDLMEAIRLSDRIERKE
mgnify:CR=1 FL=1